MDFDKEITDNKIKVVHPNEIINQSLQNNFNLWNFNGFLNNNSGLENKVFNPQEQKNLYLMAQNLLQQNGDKFMNGFNDLIQGGKNSLGK